MDKVELALMIVGYTEIFKNLFGTDKKFFKFLMTVLSGAIVITIYCLWGDNQKLMTGLTAFAYATLAYDTIVKRLKNVKGISSSGSRSGSDDSDIDRVAEEFADPEQDTK